MPPVTSQEQRLSNTFHVLKKQSIFLFVSEMLSAGRTYLSYGPLRYIKMSVLLVYFHNGTGLFEVTAMLLRPPPLVFS